MPSKPGSGYSPLTLTLKEQMAIFPASSVKVYMTVVSPIRKIEPGPIVRVTAGVFPELSDAKGSVHVTATPFVLLSLSTMMLPGQPEMTGSMLSF